MNLIDLRGRQDEPAVRRVLERSHGSTEALEEACAHYRSGEWTFIGWQEGEEILACAGAEQLTRRHDRDPLDRGRARVATPRSRPHAPGLAGRARRGEHGGCGDR